MSFTCYSEVNIKWYLTIVLWIDILRSLLLKNLVKLRWVILIQLSKWFCCKILVIYLKMLINLATNHRQFCWKFRTYDSMRLWSTRDSTNQTVRPEQRFLNLKKKTTAQWYSLFLKRSLIIRNKFGEESFLRLCGFRDLT